MLTLSIDRLHSSEIIENKIELISFYIGSLSFGIPLTKIARVINNLFLGEDYSLDRDVEILDLYRLLFGIEIYSPTAMAIFIGKEDRLYGIPLDNIPSLVTISADRIRILPDDFRTSNPLGIASHVANIHDGNSTSMLLILG